MPYVIKKSSEKGKKGYKVCKLDEPSRCFSKHPLSEEIAKKQRTAIIMSEMGTSAPRRGGNNGSSSGEMPTTIQGLKEYLNANGYDGEVHDLSIRNPKPKKADWVNLYKQAVNNPRKNTTTGTMVKDATEAFRRMGLTRSRGQSPA